MLEFKLENSHGQAVKYSPFHDSMIGVAAAANYGIIGNGTLEILEISVGGIQRQKSYHTRDALYSLAWSEVNENQVLVSSGDGSLMLFDLTVDKFPIKNWREHQKEVLSCHWNLIDKELFSSSSTDGTIKVWNINQPSSLFTFPINSTVYSIQYLPHNPNLLSSVGADGFLRVFDIRTPTNLPALQAPTYLPMDGVYHGAEGPESRGPTEDLTHDWNKYIEPIVAVGGVNENIRVLDVRKCDKGPEVMFMGHKLAVRSVSWSPFVSHVLISGGYDMMVKTWTGSSLMGSSNPIDRMALQSGLAREIGSMNAHSEFIMGLDWCLFGQNGWCASTGWDSRVLVWDAKRALFPGEHGNFKN